MVDTLDVRPATWTFPLTAHATRKSSISLPRFFGRPQSPSDPTIDEWLADFDVLVRQCSVSEGEKRAVVLIDYLGGDAKEEVLSRPDEVRRDFGALVSVLRRVFGPLQTVTSLYAEFYSRMQSEGRLLLNIAELSFGYINT